MTSEPGRGSTFRLTVVMKDAAARPARVQRQACVAALRVLCVEDNPYGRIVHSAVLRELGHVVTFVGSGEAAVERSRATSTTLSDGHCAVRHRRHRGDAAHPCAAAAGRPHSDHRRLGPHRAADAAAAMAAGMNAYLRKPASPAELNDALRMAAKLKRAGSAGSPAAK